MPVRGTPEPLLVGKAVGLPDRDIRAAIQCAAAERFDFVAVPLSAPGGQGVGANFNPSVDSDLALDAATWHTAIIGCVSEGLDPDSAPGLVEAEVLRSCLETELRWAAHLGVRGVLLPPPVSAAGPAAGMGCGYPRAISELLLGGLFDDGSGAEAGGPPPPAPLLLRVPPNSGGWLAWNRFRVLCDHHPRLGVALELLADSAATELELERWLAEPVRFVLMPPSAFILNKQGYPVLPKRHKALLLGLFKRKVEVIIAAPEARPAADAPEVPKDAIGPLLNYVARLFQGRPAPTLEETFAQSHFDCLQAPLQPLRDNLESETYELFETDPVKYAQYEEAVLAFLRKRQVPEGGQPVAVMVLGAGRGPLVAASLRAAARAEVPVAVWAVEKNPNAVHALRHRRRADPSWSCVEVIAEDMRVWQAPRPADVVVSELLGSFGDNELSPECIDGAQRLLANDGVCIPQSYTSSLAPVSAPGLWMAARGRGEGGGEPSPHLETAYVVRIHRGMYPAGPAKDCFTFTHPSRPLSSNDRYAELTFVAEVDALIHGFAGYFDCELYGDARISIKPETVSEGMYSWFPMYFPLQTPVFVRKGETLRSHWWRRHDSRKVWYEWALSEPAPTPLHNPGGRSWDIGLV